MSYSFDYFVSELMCPVCGCISKSDESTNMQTKICKKPEMQPYGIGDKLELDKENIEDSGYILVNEPDGINCFSIIETWECPNCNAPYNWALIKIENSKILSIEAIELTENVISASNYISEDCGYLGWVVNEDGVKQIEN